MNARKLSAFLAAPESQIDRVVREARRLLALQHVWEAIAPPELKRMSRVALVREGVLTLHADSGAAAAKLKQQLPRLLSVFRQRGHDLTAIRVEVQVTRPSSSRPKDRASRTIPPAGLASLEALSKELPDSQLKQALTSLVRRQRSR
jgi:predicted nucleic acid-binding Zn ribbon protein